ncbi:MAG TPA: GNAT family N-acetyltransferase [Gemmatimonadaceae bacterium]|nr:GNAT family N-acetyltransferase [Gemmatimonadaceae bacterium]
MEAFGDPRAPSGDELAAAAQLLVEAYPHRAHEPAHWSPGHEPNAARWIAESRTGEIAAYMALWPVHAAQYRMDVVVGPAFRRQGLGSSCVDFLIERAQASGATSVQARPYAEAAHAIALLERRGFRETMRMTGLLLGDVSSASVPDWESIRRAVCDRGLRLTTLEDELRHDSESWVKLAAANQAARFEWPEPDPNPDGTPHARETPDEFRRRFEQLSIAEACFIAVRGEEFIGYSALIAHDLERIEAGSGGTAVRPEYRGAGIATLLKACCVRWSQQNRVRRLATSTGNAAMIRVNEKFGFRRTYDEVRTVLRFCARP